MPPTMTAGARLGIMPTKPTFQLLKTSTRITPMTSTESSIDHICPRSTYCCITVNCGMLPTIEMCA